MKTAGLERTSAAKAGWLVIALTLGWVVFIFLADSSTPPPPEPAKITVPASSLQKAGLRDYVDWEGLPEIFAIWADHAEWKGNRALFAYWHPVTKKYSYHFEARRVNGRYRFREISEPRESEYYLDESLGDDCPIRFYKANPVPSAHAFDGDVVKDALVPANPAPPPAKVPVELPARGPVPPAVVPAVAKP
ncbi:MAG TPA: hypothetical protein VHD61_06980 [Lacunisphaera sp.]|nr:hypothetical protein [Lacunisphaera sp.]